MPVTVKFDPNVTSPQSAIIPDATVNSDGVMTKAQVRSLTGAKGASILWTFGQQTWAQVYAQARAAVAAGSYVIIYLEDNQTHTFSIDGDADLTSIKLMSARPFQQLVQFEANFRLTAPFLNMERISAFNLGTIWTFDPVTNARQIKWIFRQCAFNPQPGGPNIAIIGGNFNSVALFDSSFLQGDNPPGHTAFAAHDGAELVTNAYGESNFDGTMIELAPGAVSATWFCTYDVTCLDEFATYPLLPGIVLNRESTGDSTLLNYEPPPGIFADPQPTSNGNALDRMATLLKTLNGGVPIP